MQGEHLALAGELVLGGDQVRVGLQLVGEGAAQVLREQECERVSLAHPLPHRREHALDAAVHRREDVGDAVVFEGEPAADGDELGQVALLGHRGGDRAPRPLRAAE